MTDQHFRTDSAESAVADGEQAVADGRYLYCLVDAAAAEPGDLSTRGIDDNPVSIIEHGTVGAVVHSCETIYDAEELEQVKQWLLMHQQVIDAAGDAFGTPLPMRFDTVLKGGDASVERWLREHHDEIREELTSFAGSWEYRIHLLWNPSTFADSIAEQDDRLQELQQRQQQAGAGKAFLLEKQYTKRLQELKQQRSAELTERLQETVAPVVNEVTEQKSPPSLRESTPSTDREQVTRLAVLTDEENEAVLGDRLDEIVELDGVEIRFTGPWPPYTFAPDIG